MEIITVIVVATAAVAVVLYPLLRDDGDAAAAKSRQPTSGPPINEATLAAEVDRYRAALRAGTACRRCWTANPPGSRFCAECGRRLAGDD